MTHLATMTTNCRFTVKSAAVIYFSNQSFETTVGSYRNVHGGCLFVNKALLTEQVLVVQAGQRTDLSFSWIFSPQNHQLHVNCPTFIDLYQWPKHNNPLGSLSSWEQSWQSCRNSAMIPKVGLLLLFTGLNVISELNSKGLYSLCFFTMWMMKYFQLVQSILIFLTLFSSILCFLASFLC